MLPQSMKIMEDFQVRKSKKQKEAFRAWLCGELEAAGCAPKVEEGFAANPAVPGGGGGGGNPSRLDRGTALPGTPAADARHVHCAVHLFCLVDHRRPGQPAHRQRQHQRRDYSVGNGVGHAGGGPGRGLLRLL